MNFEPNEEQRMLCDSARKFFAREFPLARLREVESQGMNAFLPIYRKMGELGYLGIALPESAGGSGGSWLDLALVIEEAGRALVPTLQIASVALAGQALLALGDPAQQAERLADAAIALEQASAMVRCAAWLRSSIGHCPREAAMAELVAGRAIRQVTHAATLTHGGYGFMEEFDIQLYFRRAKQLEHLVEGPAMQRDLIAGENVEDLLRVH